MQQKIKEISENVLLSCKELLRLFAEGYQKDYLNDSVWINDKYYIFIDCDQEPGSINYFWFTIESANQDGYQDAIDEQDTSNISESSILYNIKYLLDRNTDKITI